jgi:hypothetical protein
MPKTIQDDIKIVTRYQTTDGKTFEKEFDACCHQQEINFEKWYANPNATHEIFIGNRPLEPEKLMEWLSENSTEVLEFLKEPDLS